MGIGFIIILFFQQIGNGYIIRKIRPLPDIILKGPVIHGGAAAFLCQKTVFIRYYREKNPIFLRQIFSAYIMKAQKRPVQGILIHGIFQF